jgi:hypothetical protein
MPTIHIEAQVSPSELIEAVDQLGTAELEGFLSQVLALRARRRAPSLPAEQADLLLQINRGLPAELRARLDELEAKREAEALTSDEHAELLRLVASLESLEVQRIEKLARLASLRGVSLPALMQDLGLKPPDHE